MISVYLCDAQPIVHRGLEALLHSREDLVLAGGCASIAELSVQIRHANPGILLIDRGFGLHTVMEWIGGARKSFPSLRVVIWAASVSDVESFRALQAGARAIVNNSAPVESQACMPQRSPLITAVRSSRSRISTTPLRRSLPPSMARKYATA